MTTITLYTKTLIDAVSYGLSEADAAAIDAALPGYIARLRSACEAAGVELSINRHDLAVCSLRDDDDQLLAQEIGQRVEFWA